MKKQRPRGVKGLAEVTQQVKGGPGAPALIQCPLQRWSCDSGPGSSSSRWFHTLPSLPVSFHGHPQGKQTHLFFPLCSQVAAKDKRKQRCLSCSSSSFLTSSVPSRSLGQLGHVRGLPPSSLAGQAALAVDLGLVVGEDSGSRTNKELRSPTCFQYHLCFLSEKWCGDKFAFIFKNKTKQKQTPLDYLRKLFQCNSNDVQKLNEGEWN